MIGARLTNSQIEQLKLCAEAHSCTVGELTRRVVTRFARVELGKPFEDVQGIAEDLRTALGLPEGTPPEELLATVSDLVDQLLELDDTLPATENPDPMAAAPAPPPIDPMAASKLSPAQVAALQKRGLPPTAEAWTALGKSVLRSAKDAPAPAPSTGRVTLSRAEIVRQASALKPEVRKAALAKGMTPEQFVIARAGVLRKAQ
jgi:hypothetical protein